METRYGKLKPYEEHVFWLEILEDHAHFLHDHLAPQESKFIASASGYIHGFHEAVKKAQALDTNADAASPEIRAFSRSVYNLALGYRNLEGHIQHLRLWNQINVNLTPTYFNGTINENGEYLRLLGWYLRGEDPPELPLAELLDLWLEDQLGHAVLLRNILDPVELAFSSQAGHFVQVFQAFMVKNRAMEGYLRFTPPGFPAQNQFAEEVLVAVQQFYDFVIRIISLYKHSRVITRTTLRFLEHHLPESCYFMRKLSHYLPNELDVTNCPLSKPSFKD
ncbi:DUF2935 domain-containing protein [Paenibacillus sp. GYB003]|uniref:DUF2935 domain-containing protein n=1 Tax=Paenibacillus sp. GYB003 TaxID=2994392 RepID=UPI002F96D7E2